MAPDQFIPLIDLRREKLPLKYTHGKIQARLQWLQGRKSAKDVTPRIMTLLEDWEETLQAASQVRAEELPAYFDRLVKIEAFIEDHLWMEGRVTDEQDRLQKGLIILKRYLLYKRYGAYLQSRCPSLLDAAEVQDTLEHHTETIQLGTLLRIRQTHTNVYEARRTGQLAFPDPFCLFTMATSALGLDKHHMMRDVIQYGQRDSTVAWPFWDLMWKGECSRSL